MTFHPRVVGTDPADRQLSDGHFDAPPPRARPTDRLEPWPTGRSTIARVAAVAHDSGLPIETAAVLIVERALTGHDLEARGLTVLLAELDVAAATSTIAIGLSEGQSAYLRVLCSGKSTAGEIPPRIVPLPMRLTERIGAHGIDRLLRPELLNSALLWERAAVISGRTMSEWATLAALDLSH